MTGAGGFAVFRATPVNLIFWLKGNRYSTMPQVRNIYCSVRQESYIENISTRNNVTENNLHTVKSFKIVNQP
jgi:hypothetical protein